LWQRARMVDQKALGGRIHTRRKALKLTQEDLAAAADVDRSFISKLEKGEKMPSLETLHLIAECLTVSVGVLLGEVQFDHLDQPPDDPQQIALLVIWHRIKKPAQLTWLRMMAAALDSDQGAEVG
jgi:transcriptional regulator with XRE-family HTH domain